MLIVTEESKIIKDDNQLYNYIDYKTNFKATPQIGKSVSNITIQPILFTFSSTISVVSHHDPKFYEV